MKIPFAGFEITFQDDPELESIGLSLFCCGCKKNCLFCQNPELQNPKNCPLVDLNYILEEIKNRLNLIDSIIFLGGDFAYYPRQLYYLAKKCKELNLKNILYTGFTFNYIKKFKYINYLDLIIDGKFLINYHIPGFFPASINQKIWKKINNEFVEVNPLNLPINQNISDDLIKKYFQLKGELKC
ncbi:MAG TPA: 4Fe-4S cluster-binding domain-containing protein [Candidatus Desulfofervidus auxilii]|uniref:4Fe-4S cluster-binding domain-containing protein n=1 Tax=Desulfofervidus auxilii TaxID=1621989 RepID=A0A7C0U1C7_DESA2|nr:4Fe-4S cluster-binding domain-containing protein [Candidatus Desulfofervidus auxilii]